MVLRVMLWVWKILRWVPAKFKCRLVYTRLFLVKVTVTCFFQLPDYVRFFKKIISMVFSQIKQFLSCHFFAKL